MLEAAVPLLQKVTYHTLTLPPRDKPHGIDGMTIEVFTPCWSFIAQGFLYYDLYFLADGLFPTKSGMQKSNRSQRQQTSSTMWTSSLVPINYVEYSL